MFHNIVYNPLDFPQMPTRPTFYHDEKPIRAGGCLFYVVKNGKREFLLRKCKHWSDVGGKTDNTDMSIMDTIVREVAEETNFSLLSDKHSEAEAIEALYSLLNTADEAYYGEKSKYLTILCEVPNEVRDLPMTRFGLREGTDKMGHYYKWTDVEDVKRHALHPRLRFHPDYNDIFKR